MLFLFSYVSDILASHCEECELVGGKKVYIPIVRVKDCKIVKNGASKKTNFAVGVVKQRFYDDKKYDCLLHRDFV